MAVPAPSDAEWIPMREAFDALVELDPDQRPAALQKLGLSGSVVGRLQRLLAIDTAPEALLVPGRAIELPPPSEPASTVAAVPQFVLPHRLGRYVLRTILGRGGMGEVFLARDTLLERDVAVKVLSPALLADAQWLPRFRREARAASALNHPNVMTVHDSGDHEGTHFLVTEFVDGETLRDRLARGRLPLGELLDCAAQILGALAAAHEAGIVHRDLKPENVMRRRDGLLKVLDFGLAKAAKAPIVVDPQQHTAVGVLVGTMRYMSPEQARGEEVDARGDVFAIGALLHELATGTPAFAGGSPLDVLVALLDRDVVPLATVRPDLPIALCRLVDRMLQKDRRERPANAAEVLAAFEVARGAATDVLPAEEVPPVRYTRSGDVDIAYQVIGTGPIDLVFVMGWISHLEWFWREPSFARFLRGLSRFSRVILFDKRGTGLSDRVATDRLPTLEQRIEDVRAVMDEVGSQRAVLCGVSEGGPMCAMFAASHPERTHALVMIGSYARRLASEDYPWGLSEAACERFCQEILQTWGGPVGISARAPGRAADPAFRDWWAAYLRHGASPNAAVALTRMNAEIDIRPVLATIGVPTLVVHRTGDRCLTVEQGRYLAASIPGARLVELPGDDHLPFVGDQAAILDAIANFVAAAPAPRNPDRQLATLLRVRVTSAANGDVLAAWRQAVVQGTAVGQARSLFLFDGELLAVFDGPVRAIRAAAEVLAMASPPGLRTATAVHLGEFARLPHGIGGAVVDESAALVAAAPDGGILASAAVRDLVAGAGIRFAAGPAVLAGGPRIGTFSVLLPVTG